MIAVTLADLVFRARQFLIALVGVALTMTMALLLAGLANGFKAEVQRTVDGVGADRWVMAEGAHGAITAFAAFPQRAVVAVGHEPGVKEAAPFLLVGGQTALVKGKTANYSLVGVASDRLGAPVVTAGDGHGLVGSNQAVVDSSVSAPVGSVIELGGRPFNVVGTVNDRTLTGGEPLIYVPLPAAQAIAVGGRPLVTAVVTLGVPTTVPSGLRVLTPDQVTQDTIAKMHSAISSVQNSAAFSWIVAAIIVASILYVAALERRRDFAILKALGSTSAKLFGSLVMEAIAVALLSAAVAEILSHYMTFIFQQPVVVPTSSYIELPLIAVVVGLLASLVALRNATRADPAAAFS